MAAARDPWWIIASTAVALHGVDPGPIGDVDLLVSPGDARRFCAAHRLPCRAGAASDRFRSAIFARWDGAPMAVEVMAGFEVATHGGWRPLRPATRMAIAIGGGRVYVPERGELAAMLRLFGRPKDLARAALLDG